MLYWDGRFKDIVSYHIPEIGFHYLFYTMNGLTYCDITQYKPRKF